MCFLNGSKRWKGIHYQQIMDLVEHKASIMGISCYQRRAIIRYWAYILDNTLTPQDIYGSAFPVVLQSFLCIRCLTSAWQMWWLWSVVLGHDQGPRKHEYHMHALTHSHRRTYLICASYWHSALRFCSRHVRPSAFQWYSLNQYKYSVVILKKIHS